jgi:hypothetical protein
MMMLSLHTLLHDFNSVADIHFACLSYEECISETVSLFVMNLFMCVCVRAYIVIVVVYAAAAAIM